MTVVRRPIVAANWKMNTTVPEAIVLAGALRELCGTASGVVVCPPAVSLVTVHAVLDGCGIALGAQNVHYEASGAHTGEVSVAMVVSVGASYVIVGHSERRARFGDTDEIVARKVQAVLAGGLTPILCVGETLDQYDAGQTGVVVTDQVNAALDGVSIDAARRIVIAYEPIWAIGTGRPATPEGANETIGTIRHALVALYGQELGSATRILYGGSVTATNADAYFGQPEIDGALVGGASLVASTFAAIVDASGRAT